MSELRLANELAAALYVGEHDDGVTLGQTDSALASKALRLYAKRLARRTTRRIVAALSVFSIGIVLVLFSTEILDLNGDGMVSRSDARLLVVRALLAEVDGDGNGFFYQVMQFPDGSTYRAKLLLATEAGVDLKIAATEEVVSGGMSCGSSREVASN